MEGRFCDAFHHIILLYKLLEFKDLLVCSLFNEVYALGTCMSMECPNENSCKQI